MYMVNFLENFFCWGIIYSRMSNILQKCVKQGLIRNKIWNEMFHVHREQKKSNFFTFGYTFGINCLYRENF